MDVGRIDVFAGRLVEVRLPHPVVPNGRSERLRILRTGRPVCRVFRNVPIRVPRKDAEAPVESLLSGV